MRKGNLTRDELITLGMLDSLPEWRQRSIETVELTSALWADHIRKLHVRPLATHSVLSDFFKDSNEQHVEVVLPVGYLPRVPILDLFVTVAEKQVYRIPLEDGARLQGLHIERLGRTIGLRVSDDLINFMAALFYTPSRGYKEIWEECNHHPFRKCVSWIRGGKPPWKKRDAVWEYLKSEDPATILGFNVSKGEYDEWDKLCKGIGKIVRLFEPTDYLSAPENPLIALPHYAEELWKRQNQRLTKGAVNAILLELFTTLSSAAKMAFPESAEDIAFLDRQEDIAFSRRKEDIAFSRRKEGEEDIFYMHREEDIVFLRRKGDDQRGAAQEFLREYAICGFRWMVFVKCKVPRNEPFIIMMEETRPLILTTRKEKEPARGKYLARKSPFRANNTVWKMVSFNDAETNHLSIRIPDTAARFHHRSWTQNNDVLGDKCHPIKRIPDEETKEGELYLRHDSTPNRASRIWVKCHLRLNRNMAWMFWLTAIITFASTVILWYRGLGEEPPVGPDHGVAAEDAAVLLIPVAFSAAILLTKDQTTIGMHLRKRGQVALTVLLFFLLASASFFYFIHHIVPH